jgi:large subunit ribosomal protein L7/L12
MPSLDELRAKLVGMIQTPATRIAQVVNAPAGAACARHQARMPGRTKRHKAELRCPILQNWFEPKYKEEKMADLAKIVDDLSNLTVMEAAELSKMLEEKWGVSAAAPVAVAAAGGAAAGGEAAAAEEKTNSTSFWKLRRQEDQRHQGSPRHHRSRPEGSQGPGRRLLRRPSRKASPRAKQKSIKKKLEDAGAKVDAQVRPIRSGTGLPGPDAFPLTNPYPGKCGGRRLLGNGFSKGWFLQAARHSGKGRSGKPRLELLYEVAPAAFVCCRPGKLTRSDNGSDLSFNGRRRIRKFFGKIPEVAEMPNLIEVQKASYDQFLMVTSRRRPF